MVPSHDPETTLRPHGENADATILSMCPRHCLVKWPTFRSSIEPSIAEITMDEHAILSCHHAYSLWNALTAPEKSHSFRTRETVCTSRVLPSGLNFMAATFLSPGLVASMSTSVATNCSSSFHGASYASSTASGLEGGGACLASVSPPASASALYVTRRPGRFFSLLPALVAPRRAAAVRLRPVDAPNVFSAASQTTMSPLFIAVRRSRLSGDHAICTTSAAPR